MGKSQRTWAALYRLICLIVTCLDRGEAGERKTGTLTTSLFVEKLKHSSMCDTNKGMVPEQVWRTGYFAQR